jgi:hydrogenase maturation factor HypF (carbamoyltransferase family)
VLVARLFVVRGRVQNVGFRYFVEDAARREGLTGWVRNAFKISENSQFCQAIPQPPPLGMFYESQ